MIGTAMQLENLTLSINEEIRVRASLDVTFEALLEQLGPGNERGDGTAMPMKLEDRHFWGVVQAIKRPSLLEITGPLFMSYPAISNVQYRLSEADGVTLIQFHHLALGLIADDHRKGVSTGWGHINENVRKRAENRAGKKTGA